MKNKIGGIYKIGCLISNNCYVGQSVDIHGRWAGHLYRLRRGTHSKHLQNAFQKYGADAFYLEVLERVANPIDLTAREQYWIDILRPRYNSAPAAVSNLGLKMSEETKQKHSINMTGNKRGFQKGAPSLFRNRKHTDAAKEQNRQKHLGRPGPNKGVPLRDEVKQKISTTKTGVPSPNKGKTFRSKGRPWSAARRAAQQRKSASRVRLDD